MNVTPILQNAIDVWDSVIPDDLEPLAFNIHQDTEQPDPEQFDTNTNTEMEVME